MRTFYKPFVETLLVALKEQDIRVEMVINGNNMLYLSHCISSDEGTYLISTLLNRYVILKWVLLRGKKMHETYESRNYIWLVIKLPRTDQPFYFVCPAAHMRSFYPLYTNNNKNITESNIDRYCKTIDESEHFLQIWNA